MTPYHEAQAPKPAPAASAFSAVIPPALLPRMAIFEPSTLPAAARCRATSTQSSASATPHRPRNVVAVGAPVTAAAGVVDARQREASAW